MSKEDILKKIRGLITLVSQNPDPAFEERDVVYLLVETYKIKERELRSSREEMKSNFPHLTFFRDWVCHTYVHNPKWVTRQNELNDPTKLLEQFVTILEHNENAELFTKMWPSFVEALMAVTKDQSIASRG